MSGYRPILSPRPKELAQGLHEFPQFVKRLSSDKIVFASSPILKRRIAWLLGQWIGHESSKPNNSRLWEILTHLLQDRGPGADLVVRITAATAIRECVDVRITRIVNMIFIVSYFSFERH